MLRAALLLLSACSYVDTVAAADGTVFDCGHGVEYCFNGDADELSDLTGLSCHESGITDRWWPGLTNLVGRGCVYSCEPGVKGANAHNGCFCEAR